MPVHAPVHRNTVQMPGNNGGSNWSGAAVDPAKGTLFVGSRTSRHAQAGQTPRPIRRWRLPPVSATHADSASGIAERRAVADRSAVFVADGLRSDQVSNRMDYPAGRWPELGAKGIKGTGSPTRSLSRW